MNHHAFLVRSASLEAANLPEEYKKQSADITHLVAENLGIDEARSLANQANQTAVGDQGRVFVILTKRMTVQAQNALLKIFEEPPINVKFFLVISPGADIISTLLSRMETVSSNGVAGTNETFTSFMSASYAERMLLIAEKTKAKDQSWIDSVFLGALEKAHTTKAVGFKKSVLLASGYSKSPGSSKKMLLEEIALSL